MAVDRGVDGAPRATARTPLEAGRWFGGCLRVVVTDHVLTFLHSQSQSQEKEIHHPHGSVIGDLTVITGHGESREGEATLPAALRTICAKAFAQPPQVPTLSPLCPSAPVWVLPTGLSKCGTGYYLYKRCLVHGVIL